MVPEVGVAGVVDVGDGGVDAAAEGGRLDELAVVKDVGTLPDSSPYRNSSFLEEDTVGQNRIKNQNNFSYQLFLFKVFRF